MVFAVVMLLLLAGARGQNFMEKSSKGEVNADYLNLVIQGALDDALGRGHGINHERLDKINATLVPLFNALPKNRNGRLNSPHMRYAVQRYFSERHGWVVKGFETHQTNVSNGTNALQSSDAHAAQIVHGKIPGYVEGALKKTISRGGFALNDIAVIVASIEALIFDETLKAVNVAYYLNGLSTEGLLGTEGLIAILKSYFILEHLNGDGSNIEQHQFDCDHIGEYYPHWEDTWLFLHDIAAEDAFVRAHSANPFLAGAEYTFEDVTRVTRAVSERFGPFSNHECHDMKAKIAAFDVHGTGRVRLSDFYSTGMFLESAEYLEQMGALDVSSAWQGPQVIIPNYFLGINNCISTSAYYDVCCLNECDAIYQHLEASFKGPTLSADEIIRVLEDGIPTSPLLSSDANTEPRLLSHALHVRLGLIAKHHDGQIPLHGRLFAQWLHYAFPRECPYPHMRGTIVRQFEARSESQLATDEEILAHVNSDHGKLEPSPEAGINMWTMVEELLDDGYVHPNEWDANWVPMLPALAHVVVLVAFSSFILKELWNLLFKAKVQKNAAREVSYFV